MRIKPTFQFLIAWLALAVLAALPLGAEGLDPAVQAKIDAVIKNVQSWAAEPAILQAVQKHNVSLSDDAKAMTQEKWKSLTVLDPFIRAFSKNEAGELLKSKKSDAIAEVFLSGADGLKIAFLAKTSNWSHKGKAKHDAPMSGKVWQGPVEVDESTGLQQVQVAVPVLDGGAPIGSLVVGIALSKLGS